MSQNQSLDTTLYHLRSAHDRAVASVDRQHNKLASRFLTYQGTPVGDVITRLVAWSFDSTSLLWDVFQQIIDIDALNFMGSVDMFVRDYLLGDLTFQIEWRCDPARPDEAMPIVWPTSADCDLPESASAPRLLEAMDTAERSIAARRIRMSADQAKINSLTAAIRSSSV